MENNEAFYIRFEKAYRLCGKDKLQISKETGINRVTLNKYLTGDSEPKIRDLIKLKYSMNLMSNYIITGELPIFETEKYEVREFNRSMENIEKYLKEISKELSQIRDE